MTSHAGVLQTGAFVIATVLYMSSGTRVLQGVIWVVSITATIICLHRYVQMTFLPIVGLISLLENDFTDTDDALFLLVLI